MIVSSVLTFVLAEHEHCMVSIRCSLTWLLINDRCSQRYSCPEVFDHICGLIKKILYHVFSIDHEAREFQYDFNHHLLFIEVILNNIFYHICYGRFKICVFLHFTLLETRFRNLIFSYINYI